MKYSASLLAVLFASAVSAADLGRNFTVNLLTKVEDYSISFPDVLPYQVPIHFNNATIKHVYGNDNSTYSVIGSLTFTETDKVQTYHLDSDRWATVVNCSVQSIGEVKHLDLTVAANQTDGGFLRFDMVSADLEGVNVTSTAANPMYNKDVEGAPHVE